MGRINGNQGGRNIHTIPNLYEHGLSWGEAAWTGLWYDDLFTPVGDPLARVTVYDPDVTGDGVVDATDLAAVLAGEHDVNGDGFFDMDDVTLVIDVYGRSAWTYPEPPGLSGLSSNQSIASPCGDVNGDGAVDAVDLALIDAYMDGTSCHGLDINRNGVVDSEDRAIVVGNMDWCIGDINGLGGVNLADRLLLEEFLDLHDWYIEPSHPDWDPIFNINCDGAIDRFDPSALDERVLLYGSGCP